MATSLHIMSYNSQGLGLTKVNYVQKLCDDCDIVLLQETLLYEDSNFLDTNFTGIRHHSVSGMDNTVLRHGRPYGGCSILWKESLLATITPLVTSSKRLCAIKANFHQFSLLLCNV